MSQEKIDYILPTITKTNIIQLTNFINACDQVDYIAKEDIDTIRKLISFFVIITSTAETDIPE